MVQEGGVPAMSVANVAAEALALPEMGKRDSGRAWAVAAAVLGVGLLVGAATVARAVFGGAGIGWSGAEAVLRVVLSCIVAGVLEEAVFRGAAFPLFIGVFRPERGDDASGLARAVRHAAIVQAGIFALMHLAGTMPEAFTWVVALQAVAKVASAFLFGLIMATLYLATRNLLVPIGVHVAYDLVSLAPQELLSGVPTTYLTGDLFDALVMLATAIALLIPAWLALRLLSPVD